MSRQNAWRDMAGAIDDDDVLGAFAVSGDALTVAMALRDRFGDIVNRISLYTPYPVDPAEVGAVATHLRAISPPEAPA
jgi:hypothetical protein